MSGGSVGEGRLRIAVDGGAWERARTVPIGPARVFLRGAPDLAMALESLDAGLERSRLSASAPLGRRDTAARGHHRSRSRLA